MDFSYNKKGYTQEGFYDNDKIFNTVKSENWLEENYGIKHVNNSFTNLISLIEMKKIENSFA